MCFSIRRSGESRCGPMVEVYIPEKGIAGRLDLARRQADEDDLPDDLLLLRELEDHESRAISHLERSNRELAEALEADDDPDFREAIAENVQVLRQKRERVAKALVDFRGQLSSLGAMGA
ncbi:unnamed protein product [Prorocentrum cordatum]|uniref:Uncharacterized protein n=2 Tax=Prorocentrum cordatum TaxID=2364126 RepID=A0ABN9VAR2_9DINO|nr:unnamed protein product [Polarella glacialis]